MKFDCQQPVPVGGLRQDENRQAMPPSGGHRDAFQNPHRVESTCSLQDFNAKFANCHLQLGSLSFARRGGKGNPPTFSCNARLSLKPAIQYAELLEGSKAGHSAQKCLIEASRLSQKGQLVLF